MTRSNEGLGEGARPPVRYIKLGRGGSWAEAAFRDGVLPLGYGQVPHDLATGGNRDAIVAHLVAGGRSPDKAASFAREVLDFYQLGSDAIWITFAKGHLWWARADPAVTALAAPQDEPQRQRAVLGPWSNANAKGRLLREDGLSTRLTKVAAYQQTICKVEAEDYLLRKLAGEDLPIVTAAAEAQSAACRAAEDLIAGLQWVDFETLVDLVLARGGWHRTSALGGTQRDADLLVEQPITGETALVQVKSAASQATLDDYLGRFDAAGRWTRLIFVCHSPSGPLDTRGRTNVSLWTRGTLAAVAVRSGLLDWLMERAA